MPQDSPPEKNRTGLILGIIVLIVAAGIGVFFVTKGNNDADNARADAQQQAADVLATAPSIPDISIPDISIPNISIPDISIPAITIPEIPPISLPPGVTLPPGITIPGQTETTETTAPAATTAATTPAEPVNLFTGTQAADVVADYAAARGATPLRILELLLYPNYSFAQVQDPSIPANVDQYDWRDGAVSPPAPVQLTGDGDLESNLFSDSDVNWAAIPALADAALAAVPIEGAAVTHIIIHRNLPFSDQIQIRVFVDGTRSSGYVDADSQGNITFVEPG